MSENKCYSRIVSMRAFAASAIVLLHVIAGWIIETPSGGKWHKMGIRLRYCTSTCQMGCSLFCNDNRLSFA